MKRFALYLASAILISFLVLFFLFTDKDYMAEKLFYRAKSTHSEIMKNPDATPPAMSVSVERDLQKIMRGYPDSELARHSYMALAEFYITEKRYEDAVAIIGAFLSEHEASGVSLLSKAYFLKGMAYEKKGEWHNAVKEYEILRDEYHHTPIGLQSALYIAQRCKGYGNMAETLKKYEDAIALYKRLCEENRGTMLGYSSSTYLIRSYIETEKYEEAGSIVEANIYDYPTPLVQAQQIPLIELIFVKKLKDADKAVKIYEYLIKNTEDAEFKKLLHNKIKRANEAKQQTTQ